MRVPVPSSVMTPDCSASSSRVSTVSSSASALSVSMAQITGNSKEPPNTAAFPSSCTQGALSFFMR